MAYILEGGAEIRLDKDERTKLGREFISWADTVEDKRRRLMHETWVKALENYEGKEPVKQFPWPGASNAVLPITATHSDAISARLFGAATAHDPVFLVLPYGQGEIIPDVTVEKYALWWQNLSKWVENEEIDLKTLMEEVCLHFTLYGDAFVYLPWEVDEVMDVEVNEKGKAEKIKRTLYDRPMPRVLHPKDVYLNSWEKNIQTARRVGIRWELDLSMLDMLAAKDIYGKEQAKHLREMLTGQETKRKESEDAKLAALGSPSYYKEWGGRSYSPDELEKALAKKVGVDEEPNPHCLRMLKVFTRADLDGDGIPEEIVFDVERSTGYVPYARYANLKHRQRPIIQFSYNKRAGCIYSRGVPELLANIQKILNTVMRDILDNNKVQNTKMFVAKKGGPIEENAKVYPTRIFFVDSIETDFKAVDLGSGRPVTSISDLSVIQSWGERVTGITDSNLGQEKRSRTPATTTMALLEEGNKRMDRVIELMRNSMKDMWGQVLHLYFQNGDPATLAEVAGIEDGDRELFMLSWAAVDHETFRKRLLLRPEVSSNSLNRAVQRQEKLTLFAQVDAYYDRIIQLADAIGGATADPVMRELFLKMSRGGQRLMTQVLDTFDVKNQEELNPDFQDLLTEVQSVPVPIEGGTQTAPRRSNPAQAAAGMVANQAGQSGPVEAVGRPAPGLPRTPGPTPGS